MKKISLEDQFQYHPPLTEERKAKHDLIGRSALTFAQELRSAVGCDDPMFQQIVNCIQQARMLANQAVTYQDILSRDEQ